LQTLLENFSKHYESFNQNGKLTDDFFHFLKFWLSAHIQGIDKKYGEAKVVKKNAS
jgi:hemerythrin